MVSSIIALVGLIWTIIASIMVSIKLTKFIYNQSQIRKVHPRDRNCSNCIHYYHDSYRNYKCEIIDEYVDNTLTCDKFYPSDTCLYRIECHKNKVKYNHRSVDKRR